MLFSSITKRSNQAYLLFYSSPLTSELDISPAAVQHSLSVRNNYLYFCTLLASSRSFEKAARRLRIKAH